MSNKRGVVVLLSILAISIYSTLAQAANPSSYISSTTDFFRDLVSGNASIQDAGFLAFILYFIIFLAIFVEGLRKIPIFDKEGKINKQGKIFAAAASGLSTIAIFMVEQGSGVSSVDRVANLVAPFGIFGGILVAVILSYITFRLMKNTGAFKDNILTPMAITAAVGMVVAGFLLSLDNIIGWGYLIAILAMIVGAIVTFAKHRSDTKGDRDKAAGEQIKSEQESYKKDKERKAQEKERNHRENEVKHPKSYLVKAIKNCDNLLHDLEMGKSDHRRERATKSAERHAHDLHNNLHHATYHLRRARKGADYDFFQEQFAHGGTAITQADQITIPEHDDEGWVDDAAKAKGNVETVSQICGAIISALDGFVGKKVKEAQEKAAKEVTKDQAKKSSESKKEATKKSSESSSSESSTSESGEEEKKRAKGYEPVLVYRPEE